MSEKNQYDVHSDQYESGFTISLFREFVLIPTIQEIVGDLSGKKILDLACGGGFFSRFFKSSGALEVVGVDASADMIQYAKEKEAINPLGIHYVLDDIRTINKIDSFDIAFASFCLHYSENVFDLEKMCRSIAKNLKPGGKLIAFNENPDKPIHHGIPYYDAVIAEGEIKDGVKIKREHYSKEMIPEFTFTHYHYQKSTYNTALKNAGFVDIQWRPFTVSKSAPSSINWDQIKNNDYSISVLCCQHFE